MIYIQSVINLSHPFNLIAKDKGKMKKIQVKPASIGTSSESYKPNLLVDYPNDVKGDDEKMIEYGNEIISMWTLEVQCLQERRKELKEVVI